MRLTVNGEQRVLDTAQTLRELLLTLNLDPRKVAVERNREIVPRTSYATVTLQDGDALEIVHFIGGG